MERLKVLHINTIDTGGAAIAAIRLHKMLRANGVDSKILFLRRSGNASIDEAYYFEDLFPKTVFRFLDKCNTLYNRRFTFSQPEVYFNGPDSLFDLSQHPQFQQADVIHFHWVVKFIDWPSVFLHNKKFVWTLHDMNPFTGGEHYQTGYHGEFKKTAERNIRKKIRATQSSSLTIVSPSEWLQGLASQSEVFRNKSCLNIRNPIDTDIFKPLNKLLLKEKFGLSREKKTLLFVAENPHDVRKGFRYLTEALKNQNNYQLAIAGNPEQVKEIFPDALFAGSIKDERILAEWYNAADAFVIPSIEDNLPNTVSEALLCGTPVCGFAVGGIKEMVINGLNGQLASDFDSLREALHQLSHSDYDSNKIRHKALEQLNSEKLLTEFISVYQS